MTFRVRYPRIDFSNVRPHWARNIAFAQHHNATSLIPTPIEPWLIKILQKAMDSLPGIDAPLRAEVEAFIGQESQHFRQHRLFNKVMIAHGYPKLAEFEKQLTDDLEGFFCNRSLKFLLSYADGFESLGAGAGGVWFENSDALLEGADPNAVALWKWHMAEEFEHREVCFKFFHAIYSRGFRNVILNGYFYRIYGAIFAMKHLNRYTKLMHDYLLDTDRQAMNEEQKANLDRDLKELATFQRKHTLPQLLKVLLPWYDPGRKPTPRGLFKYLRQFEPGGAMARVNPMDAVAA